MRIKIRNKIFEVDLVIHSKDSRFVEVRTSNNSIYSIDCEKLNYAEWLMHKLLTDGYFDASGVDYNNDQGDMSWYQYCYDKTEEQKVFEKWINGL